MPEPSSASHPAAPTRTSAPASTHSKPWPTHDRPADQRNPHPLHHRMKHPSRQPPSPNGLRGPVTMAMAQDLQDWGYYELANIARRYAIDRPRWWKRRP